MGQYTSSHITQTQQSHLWIGYQTSSHDIKVLNYNGEDYYTGWGIRQKLIKKGIIKTTSPFLAKNKNEALDLAYLRILA